MAHLEGTRLGRYEIRSLLGAGGMGEVYLAQDLNLHRPVALKVLKTELTAESTKVRRFEREAEAASSLNHPNIITIYEIGTEGETHFIVTEYVDGVSLGQRLQQEGFTLSEVVEIGVQISSALTAAHAANIMHRDIKPDNVMLRRDGLVKVLDFGLAKLSDPEEATAERKAKTLQTTIPGILLGTAQYMSPEQARGLPADKRTDIWSLGVVLYQMLAGQMPFRGETMSDVIAAILTKEAQPLTTCAPDVPEELQQIVVRALRKNKEERYQSIAEVSSDLQAFRKKLQWEAELRGTNQETFIKRISYDVPADEKQPVFRESSAEFVVNQIKLHKRAAWLIVLMILTAVVAVGYFGYSRLSGGHFKSGITSIAVLPFANSSNNPDQQYLSDGISESLINRLSQLPGVKVIANTSSLRYRGKESEPQEVAHALGVVGVITGRVLQRGDTMQISVELIDGRDRTQVWGERYNRKTSDLLSIQADISSEIAENLRLHLTPGQQQQIAKSENANEEGYELLLKGRFFRAKGGTDDRTKAADYFKQAIAVDPSSAAPYADLSDIYRSLASSGVVDPKEYLPLAENAARKALELDQNLAEAHYALANLLTYDWKWSEAESEYKRAIRANPNLALAHRWYAAYLRLLQRHDEAIAEIKLARDLDPLSSGVCATVGYIYASAGQYDQAIESLNKTLELEENYPYAHLFLGFTYSAKGMTSAALASYQKAIKLGLDTPTTQIVLGMAYARNGERQRAQEILKQLLATKNDVSPAELAILYESLGEREQAFASLEKAYEAHDLQLQYLGVDVGFDPLRSDPRFQDLMRRVGLVK